MKEDFKEEFTKIFLTILIIGILISSFSVYFFRNVIYGQKIDFTELFFTEPDLIPNDVYINQTYVYGFGLNNHESNTINYSLSVKTELYNLYDFYENRFNCMSKYRKKVFLDWTNVSYKSVLTNNDNHFEHLYVHPTNEVNNWTQYTMTLLLPPPIGKGKLAIKFSNSTDLKYSIIIDNKENKMYFNDILVSENLDFNHLNNWLNIKVTDIKITISLNDDILLDSGFFRGTNGFLSFESVDAYFRLQFFTVYQYSHIEIPDRGNIIEYAIEDQFLTRKIIDIQQSRQKIVRLSRTWLTYNETIDCDIEPFYCRYFDIPNDISFNLKDTNISRFSEKIPVVDAGYNIKYISKMSSINWSNFTISFAHRTLSQGSKGHLILDFSEKWGIMITRNNSYFIERENNSIRIDEIRNPRKFNSSNDIINISIEEGFISLFINEKNIFSKKAPLDYTNGYFTIYEKNEYFSLDPINIKKIDPICQDPDYFGFCEVSLLTVYRQQVASFDNPDYTIEYEPNIKSVASSLFAPLINNTIMNISLKSNNVSNNTINDLIKPIFNEFKFDIDNEFIPNERIIFDKSLQFKNSSSSSLDYSYYNIDGAGIMGLGVLDKYGQELISMHVIPNKNEVYIYNLQDGKQKNWTIKKIFETTEHSLRIVNDENTHFYIDNSLVFNIKDTHIFSGTFFIESLNTYSYFGDVHYQNSGIKRTLFLKQDPCEFKLTYQSIKNENIILNPEESKIFTENLVINQDFDFGKVSVTILGGQSNNDTQEIHYWFKRKDV